jgi:hypothetical protein
VFEAHGARCFLLGLRFSSVKGRTARRLLQATVVLKCECAHREERNWACNWRSRQSADFVLAATFDLDL